MFTDKFKLIEGEELKLKLIETVKGEYAFDLLPFYYYEILDLHNNSIGKISFRIGFNEYTIYNGNIGYEINDFYRGNNYSLKAMYMLKPLILYHKFHTLFLVINEDNIASNKIALKAKGKLIGKLQVPKHHKFYHSEELTKNVYIIDVNYL
jgi:predicted acetyltransferase